MVTLRKLKITHKLALIMAVVLIGFAAVGITYKVVLEVEKNAAQNAERLAEFAKLTETVHVSLLDAQHTQKEFLIYKNVRFVKHFETKMAETRYNLVQLEKLAPENMDLQPLDNLDHIVRLYHGNFYDMAEAQVRFGLTENEGLKGSYRDTVHDLEALLNKYNATALTASMLMMRRHEKDYLLRGNTKYVDKLTKELGHFISLLKRAKMPPKAKGDTADLITGYHKKFLDMVRGNRQVALGVQAMTSITNQLNPLFQALAVEKDRVVADNNRRNEGNRALITVVFVGTLVVIGLLLAISLFLFSRGMTKSLRRLRDTVNKVGDGDFNARVALATGDELGSLGGAFDHLLDERLTTLSQAEKENDVLNDSVITLLEAVSELSQKDLTVSVPVHEDITGPVADAMNLMAKETAGVLNQIRDVAQEVEAAANTVKQQGDKVSDVAAGERVLVEQTMVKLEQAANTMNDIATLAQTCNEVAARASSTTERAMETVTNTVGGMNEIREIISETEKRIKRLGDRSQEITGIVEIINNIAERTHVLALNASMQAAAAGEAGRGFAVVADEVQRLAESSRNSTSQIAALVNNIQTETSETMSAMNKTISQVVEGSELAERAGREMQETQQNTAELVSNVKHIAEQSLVQADVSNKLRDEARTIETSTQETGEELKEQNVQTQNLVQYARRLMESVQVFKLPVMAKKESARAPADESESEPAAEGDKSTKPGWTPKQVISG